MTEPNNVFEQRRLHRRKNDRFEQHVIDEIASLRASLDIQFKRIAQIQAELDLSQRAIEQRSLAFAETPAAGRSRRNDGNGNSQP